MPTSLRADRSYRSLVDVPPKQVALVGRGATHDTNFKSAGFSVKTAVPACMSHPLVMLRIKPTHPSASKHTDWMLTHRSRPTQPRVDSTIGAVGV